MSRDLPVESERIHHSWRDSVFGVGVDQERGHHVLDQPEGCLLLDTYSFRLLTLFQDLTWRQRLPVQGFVFWPYCNSPGLHQSVYSAFRMGSQEGDTTHVLSG